MGLEQRLERLERLLEQRVSRSLKEFVILPHKSVCRPENVDLSTRLGPIKFRYPFFTARMQSVVGPDMILAAGRQGILPCIPRSLPRAEKEALLDVNDAARLRAGQIQYVDQPVHVAPTATLAEVRDLVESTGYSVIPVLNWLQEVLGFYIHDPERQPAVAGTTPISLIARPLSSDEGGVPFLTVDDPARVDDADVHRLMDDHGVTFLPIIDHEERLRRLAFRQRYDTNFIGLAIDTGGDWRREIDELGARADTLMTDSSNAWYDTAILAITYAKERFPKKPFGAGNIVTRAQFRALADAGADYLIVGMAVGSICQTGSYRGNGRGQATAMLELAQARDEYAAQTGRYVPLVLDGGASSVKDLIIALSHADFVMMGFLFNQFHEAAGQGLDRNLRPVPRDIVPVYKETWGEGSVKARRIAREGMGYAAVTPGATRGNARYGHATNAGVTVEGVAGYIPCAGRLKPGVEDWARYIRTTISSAGGRDLASYRDSVREHGLLELLSEQTIRDLHPHDVNVE